MHTLNNLSEISIKSERLILAPLSMDYEEIITKEFVGDITKYMFERPTNTKCAWDFIKKTLR